MLWVQPIAFAGFSALAISLSGPALFADGKLAGFGNIPFGTDYDVTKRAKGIEVREDACASVLCQLVYRTTVSDLPVTVWQSFTERHAAEVEVQVRGTGEQGRFPTASRCDATYNRVYVMLLDKYGQPDVPVLSRTEPGPTATTIYVREVTFTFTDGAQVRQKRDLTEDGTCAVRVFYRPASTSAGDATF